MLSPFHHGFMLSYALRSAPKERPWSASRQVLKPNGAKYIRRIGDRKVDLRANSETHYQIT